ncbi:hypothetical protein [Lysobacter enzymogenes]|uniref:hypothetical protein n=1 Tax=Lysobacter enzymogenes TaxID=69 RepID=UPI001AFB5D5E|nr:hypothetical protein [Lysobacter enzymogenes]QQQ00797.1 hypothetical protein JHW41_22465 [Lysobacter enzymogenes]
MLTGAVPSSGLWITKAFFHRSAHDLVVRGGAGLLRGLPEWALPFLAMGRLRDSTQAPSLQAKASASWLIACYYAVERTRRPTFLIGA